MAETDTLFYFTVRLDRLETREAWQFMGQGDTEKNPLAIPAGTYEVSLQIEECKPKHKPHSNWKIRRFSKTAKGSMPTLCFRSQGSSEAIRASVELSDKHGMLGVPQDLRDDTERSHLPSLEFKQGGNVLTIQGDISVYCKDTNQYIPFQGLTLQYWLRVGDPGERNYDYWRGKISDGAFNAVVKNDRGSNAVVEDHGSLNVVVEDYN